MNTAQALADATRRLRVIIHVDHMCALVNLDLSEMDRIVQVQSTVWKAFRFELTSIMSFFFCIILVPLFLSDNLWTLTSVKETTLVTRMQTASTPLDHMNVTVSLDIPEMDKIAQVNLMHFV